MLIPTKIIPTLLPFHSIFPDKMLALPYIQISYRPTVCIQLMVIAVDFCVFLKIKDWFLQFRRCFIQVQ
jgi:hypothetical protein